MATTELTIRQLADEGGTTPIAPVTVTDAVLKGDGTTLTEELTALNNGLMPVYQSMTESGSYSTVIDRNYGATVFKAGNMCIARIAVTLKARTGASGWLETFTVPYPSKYNLSTNAITQQGKVEQVRVDGEKFYMNIFNTVASGDLLSVIVPYITE